MPRTGKGGNRTDLIGQPTEAPITVAKGQPYGQEKEQADEQRAVPMAGAPQTPTMSLAQTLKKAIPAAGSLPFLEPSTSGLPITHGLPFGPGAGPEAMGQPPASAPRPLAATLNELSASPNASPQLASLAEGARLLGV